jgi:transcriptional regulator with XRE-family HTH domain
MPRSPEIDHFAEKLSVMLDRLSLSRVQLAKLAGVDKSVSGRWASGRARPGEQSIVRLTDILRREIAGFSRDEWNLPVDDFAVRLGLPRRSPAAMSAGDDAPGPDPKPQDTFAAAAQRYAGLWLLTHAAFTGLCHVYAFLAELRPEDGGLGFEMADSAGYRARGTARIGEGKLCLLAEATSHAHWPCYFIFNGVSLWRAVMLDGLLLSWGRDVSRAPVALRTIGFRLGRHEPERDAACRRFESALAILDCHYDDDRLQRALPGWVADQLLGMTRDPSRGALRLTAEQSQAVDETTLATCEPEAGPRRRALRALEDLFRDALSPG